MSKTKKMPVTITINSGKETPFEIEFSPAGTKWVNSMGTEININGEWLSYVWKTHEMVFIKILNQEVS